MEAFEPGRQGFAHLMGALRGFLLWGGLIVLVDQITKWLARANLAPGQSIPVIPSVFDITLVFNEGVAFGLLPGLGFWLSPLAAIVAILAAVGYAKARPEERLFRVSMVLLAAGAVGNLIDRIFNRGRVTDFIDIKVIHVFNIADASITVAAVLLATFWLLELRGESHGKDAP